MESEQKIASDEVLVLNSKKIELQQQIDQIQSQNKKAVAKTDNKGDHQKAPSNE